MNISSVSRSDRGRRWRLKAGLSPVALLVASFVCDSALAQSLSNLMQQKLSTPTPGSAATTTTATMRAVTNQSAQSLQRSLNVIQSNPTASALVQLQNRQAAPNTYINSCAVPGPLCGIQPDTSATATWTNVELPTKDLNPAAPVATVVQTKSKGIATWKSLNLAPGETLDFKQPDSNSILLNRINDLNPTQIFGRIKANGQIYLINGNGIIFGGSAKVDVHALIASSLDIGSTARNPANGMSIAERNAFFLERGIAATQAGNLVAPANGAFLGDFSACRHASCALLSGPFEGSVVVKSGAQITTTVTSSAGSPEEPGFVYLLAPYVRNDGAIASPRGQVMLATGQNFTLTPKNNGQIYSLSDNQLSGGDNTGFARAVGLLEDGQSNPTWLTIGPGNAAVDQNFRPSSTGVIAVGTAANSGLIDTTLGTTFISATTIDHSGIIQADTGVTRNGSIVLQAARTLTLSPTSALLVRPARNGETTPISASGASPFEAPIIRLTGEAVTLQGNGADSGAVIYAPSASVSITARADGIVYQNVAFSATPARTPQQRVYLDTGSLIDVSGVEATLPVSANLVTFQPRGQEFADSPLQRQGALRGEDITIDIRKSGTRADGFQWIGTPLADASGFVNLIPRNIDYLLTTGGKITINSIGDVVTQAGSKINYNGGLVTYEGGVISTTRLLGADGRIRDIAAADPLGSYVGIAGTQSFTSSKWGITNTYTNALLSGSVFEAGYVDGRSAGSLTIAPSSGVYLAGSISGATVAGAKQAAGTVKGNGLPSAGSLTVSTKVSSSSPAQGRGDICIFGGTTACGAGQVLPTAPLSAVASLSTSDLFLSADALSNTGLGQIALTANGNVTVAKEAALSVPAGGSITLTGFSADIEGTLRANAGTVSVRALGIEVQPTNRTPTQTGITVGSTGVIDASGLWINDAGVPATAITGAQRINGGTISLTTDLRSGAGQVDVTGSITLLAGSLLDVSSGGYVQPNGRMLLDSVGRPAGNGGNLRLVTGSGTYNLDADARADTRPSTTALSANVVMNGSIRAFGFSRGGTLSLQVPTIQIGGTPFGDPGEFDIDPARFFGTGTTASPGMGFARYALTATSGGIVVQPNTTIALRQVNFAPIDAPASLPTGASVASATGLVRQSEFQTSSGASGLSLTDAGLLDAPLPARGYLGILIGDGAKIVGDGGAAIRLASATIGAGQTRRIDVFGSINAPGGTIDITGASAAGTSTIVRLGAQATLDVAGKVLLDPQRPFVTGRALAGGTVNVALAARGSVLVGDPGTTIDVSGAAGSFDLSIPSTSSGLSFSSLASTPVWSDAGSISISAQTVLYGGRYVGRAGAPEGRGGSLTLSGPTGGPGPGASTSFRGIVVVQSVEGNALAASFGGVDEFVSQLQFSSLSFLNNSATLVVDSLNGSGIANVSLLANVVNAGTLGTTVSARGDVVLYGNALSLQVPGSLVIDAQRIVQLPDAAGVAPTASLTAGYVSLSNSVPVQRSASSFGNTYPTVTGGTLRVNAKAIDIANLMLGIGSESRATANIAQAFFTSAGDIRLSVPTVNSDPDQLQNLTSQVYSAGDITFRAAQVYPVSGVDATLKSQGTIRFEQNGPTPAVPLSAGGRLTVDATRIEQFGTIRAPLGKIVLGARSIDDLSPNDSDVNVTTIINPFTQEKRTERVATRFVDTQDVILGAGSLTSVSLEGAVVPFGHTNDGGLWSFYTQRFGSSSLGTSQPAASLALAAAPSKRIGVNGGSIALNSGAVIDVSGGGDIQAIEFIAGTGGSRDVLAPTYSSNGATLPQYADGRAIYAILPSYKGPVAPIDFDFQATYGDRQPAAGSSVYLSGGSGLAAGVYTLLPAHYATLPGAYRVVVRAAGNDAVPALNGVQTDGSMLISGYGVNALTGGRDARNSLYEVQSGDVWRLYSQIDSSSGNKRFGALNAKSGTVAQVPADAGNLVVAAVRSLSIDSTLKSTGDLARGGRGGEVDVSSQNIQILGSGATALAGYLAIDSAALSAFAGTGASLVIGGVRDIDSSGKTSVLTPIASSVVITNSAIDPLSAPEVILVAQPKTGDANSANGIVVAPGSVVTAVGTLQAGQPASLTIGQAVQGSTAGTSGSGSFLRVANGALVTVTRRNVVNGAAGQLTVGANAVLGGQSVALDSTGSISVAPSVTLVGGSTAKPDAVSLSAANIGFDVPVGSGLNIATVDGAGLRTALFDSLIKTRQLRLAAAGGAVAFGGSTDLILATAGSSITVDAATIQSFGAISSGGSVNIGASRVTLSNSGSGVSTAQSGAASLAIAGDEIVLAAGDKAVSGFGTVTMSAREQISFGGAGSLNALNADVSFVSPLVIAATAAKQTVTTTGALVLSNGGAAGASLPADGPGTALGGQLAFAGRSITQSTTIQAIAGAVTLAASTGNVTLTDGARIVARGFAQKIFDVETVAGGGSVTLSSASGNVLIDTTQSRDLAIDVSAADGNGVSQQVASSRNAGQITLRATAGDIAIKTPGVLAGVAHGGKGGSLTLDGRTIGGGAVGELDRFAAITSVIPAISASGAEPAKPASGGFDEAFVVRTRQGDLRLSQGLKARSISLTADGGAVAITGAMLDASARQGGSISLIGRNGVDISGGRLRADATDATQRGGSVVLETLCNDPAACSGIVLRDATSIDVSGANGGTVTIRAPLFAQGGGFDIAVSGGRPQGVDLPIDAAIRGARTIDVVANRLIDAANFQAGSTSPDRMFNGVIDPAGTTDAGSSALFVNALTDYVQSVFPTVAIPNIAKHFEGASINGVSIASGGPTVTDGIALISAADSKVAEFRIKPGIELDNSSSTVNGGNISLVSSWNLGALDDNGRFRYRVGGSQLGAAGELTLRAIRDVNIGSNDGSTLRYASLTDGFAGATANAVSPTAAQVAAATVFRPVQSAIGPILGPDGQRYRAPDSWSYTLVAGADFAGANRSATIPIEIAPNSPVPGFFAAPGSVNLAATSAGTTPTVVRTGTGSITVAAARDVDLCVVAGLLCQQSTTIPRLAEFQPGAIYSAGVDTVDPVGFIRPTEPGCALCIPAGPYSIAYPTGGGALTVTAQGNVNSFQAVRRADGTPFYQFWSQWLLASVNPASNGSTWGINFGGFGQGLMSVGGDVRVVAGGDLNQLSISLPTTARTVATAGGVTLNTTSSGNLAVVAGGDLLSGSYYVGSGVGDIRVSGSVRASWTSTDAGPADPVNVANQNSTSIFQFLPTASNYIPTLLAVDNGNINLAATRSISIAGVVSPISLQNLSGNNGGANTTSFASSYGPDSAVRVQSVAGDIATNGYIDPTTGAVFAYNPLALYAYGSRTGSLPSNLTVPFGVGANAYPATFQAAALRGDLTVAGSIQLAPSNTGQLDLIADGSLTTTSLLSSNVTDGTRFFSKIGAEAVLSTGPTLLGNGFDPYMPWWNAVSTADPDIFGYPASNATVLLHQDDPLANHFYARTGDITNGKGTSSLAVNALAWEITKRSDVRAGRDIVDLNFFGQNLSDTDVTSVKAGRDLFYTGKNNSQPRKAFSATSDQSVATLRLAGPGSFEVEAGRDLGPFLLASTLGDGQGIVTIGNASEVSSGYIASTGGIIGNRIIASINSDLSTAINPTLNTFAPSANSLLPRKSASISISFGVSPGGTNAVEYQAFIDAYLDPAKPHERDYGTDLLAFLKRFGVSATSTSDAFAKFKALSTALQEQFARQVFFEELKLVGDPDGCCFNQPDVGLKAIATLFPAANGFASTGTVATGPVSGDLNLLHSTVQTRLGGDVTIIGPAGSIILGSIEQPTVTRRFGNSVTTTAVPLQNEGLLTIAGGAIRSFTDGSVLVNQSRIFTQQGGDIVLWSTNGDLDAGRGAKTSASFPPLEVQFPRDNLQIVDLAGLVTGAGIAVLQSTPEAPVSDLSLIALRGIVNAGDAGIRSSGNLNIAANRVENASNISVGGKTSGVPATPTVNLGSTEAASSAAASSSKASQDSESARQPRTTAQSSPSLITVEVLGYGGVRDDDPRLREFDCSIRKGPGC